jgi:hypothetical protein
MKEIGKYSEQGWGYNSVVQHLPSTWKALGSSPCSEKRLQINKSQNKTTVAMPHIKIYRCVAKIVLGGKFIALAVQIRLKNNGLSIKVRWKVKQNKPKYIRGKEIIKNRNW